MTGNQKLIELLKFYKEQKTIKRPEVGTLTGKSIGQIAGLCRKNDIQPWPDISDKVMETRGCQFPILKNGERCMCGKSSTGTGSLCCTEHRGMVWDPDKEDVIAVDDPTLLELFKFYKKEATVTKSEVGILTGKTLGQIEGICRSHDIKSWPNISPIVARDRHCQFPILKNGGRRTCGLMRSQSTDADPLRCSDHREMIWDPIKE